MFRVYLPAAALLISSNLNSGKSSMLPISTVYIFNIIQPL